VRRLTPTSLCLLVLAGCGDSSSSTTGSASTSSGPTGDELRLSDEECASPSGGDTFVKSTYRWKLLGTTLRLTTVKSGCPDKVAETILTAHALRRSGA